jgi:hypothetical protein
MEMPTRRRAGGDSSDMAGLKEDNMTDNQDTHISKLDDLFDQACEYLSDLPSSAYEPQFIQMSLDIIDRWLAVREQDRQYELKISPINDTRNRIQKIWNDQNNLKKSFVELTNALAKRIDDLKQR